ncbi:MAG: hypothetical protein V3W41_00835 [Planctomycetota bacterium]
MPTTRRYTVLIALVMALVVINVVPSLVAQVVPPAQGPPVVGTEIFFVPNYNNVNAGNFRFDNIVVAGPGGTMYTVTFTLVPTTGAGTYGAMHPEGPDYTLEFVWLVDDGGNGFTPGHSHNTADLATPGNFYENSHFNGTSVTTGQALQGVRLVRNDGLPFQLISLDYGDTMTSLLIGAYTGIPGMNYTGYADTANWVEVGVPEGLSLANTTFNQIIFGTGEVSSLIVDRGAQLVFGAGNMMTITGVIGGYTTPGGVNITTPAVEPLIGTSFSVTGTFSGTDPIFLSGAAFAPATIFLSANPGFDDLIISSSYAHNPTLTPDYFSLSGAWEAQPTIVRAITSLSPGLGVSTRIGSGSQVLDFINSAFSSANISFVFNLTGGTPTLASIELDYIPPATEVETKLNTSGNGDLILGLSGFQPGSRIYNFFDINPSQAVGTGPFFGINFGDFQIAQLGVALGGHPFHISADMNGAYFFGAFPATVPTGTVLDHTAIEITAAGPIGSISEVSRLTF